VSVGQSKERRDEALPHVARRFARKGIKEKCNLLKNYAISYWQCNAKATEY
jgi:hypothetical protein